MRPKERCDSGQNDLFRARLDQIVDMAHPLAKLAAAIDWGFLEQRFGAVYSDGSGQPPLPTRLMAGLAILKHTHATSARTKGARRSTACTRRRSNASAKARRIALMSSV